MLNWFLSYNNMNQSRVCIHTHTHTHTRIYIYLCIPSPVSLLPIQPLWVVTQHLSTISALHKAMHAFQCYPLNSSHPLLPQLCPQVRSLYLCLYSYPANRFISTIFLDSIYMHQGFSGGSNCKESAFQGQEDPLENTIFVFLFLTYFILYDKKSKLFLTVIGLSA